jgi:hypothetical protein
VEYGLGTEAEVTDIADRTLRDELIVNEGLKPLSWLMIGQWGRTPTK